MLQIWIAQAINLFVQNRSGDKRLQLKTRVDTISTRIWAEQITNSTTNVETIHDILNLDNRTVFNELSSITELKSNFIITLADNNIPGFFPENNC